MKNTSHSKVYQFYINKNTENINNLKYKKDNLVKLTKYNIFSFFPKSLLLQFNRLANIYFLIIAIIQSIPVISPLTPVTAIGPLLVVLAASMAREGWEEYKRYMFDSLMNNVEVTKYNISDNCWTKIKSSRLRVGEIVLIKNEETCPTDIIVLDSNNIDGLSYIETADLDGEKTLKKKNAVNCTSGLLNNSNGYLTHLPDIQGRIQCDSPNSNLYQFEGKLEISLSSSNKDLVSLNSKNLILKASVIKNTKWIIGLNVYVGHDCKIIKNTKSPKNKISNTEKTVSKLILGILFFQIMLCIISAILYSVYSKDIKNSSYLNLIDNNINIESLLSYFTYLLLLNTMIPISLIITLELVKLVQGIFMNFDIGLYSKTRKCKPKIGSVSINEELGQVTHIFTDKTGTLTKNKMCFSYSVIGTNLYEINNNSYFDKDVQNNCNNIIDNNEFYNKDKNVYNFKKNKDYSLNSLNKDNISNILNQNSNIAMIKKNADNYVSKLNENSRINGHKEYNVSIKNNNNNYICNKINNHILILNNNLDQIKDETCKNYTIQEKPDNQKLYNNKIINSTFNNNKSNMFNFLNNKIQINLINRDKTKDIIEENNNILEDLSNKEDYNRCYTIQDKLKNNINKYTDLYSNKIKIKEDISENHETSENKCDNLDDKKIINSLKINNKNKLGNSNNLTKNNITNNKYNGFISNYTKGLAQARLLRKSKSILSKTSIFRNSVRQMSIKDLEDDFKLINNVNINNIKKITDGFMSKVYLDKKLSINNKKLIEEIDYNLTDEYTVTSDDNKTYINLSKQEDLIYHYWTALALANECIVEKKSLKDKEFLIKHPKSRNINFSYSGMSPDDVELVYTSARQGYELTHSDHRIKRLNIGIDNPIRSEFSVLNLFEFSSDRKKMSIIVKDSENRIIMYTKGADNIIYNSLSKNNLNVVLKTNIKYTSNYSKKGFRTLSIAIKIFSEDEYNNLNNKISKANLLLENRQATLDSLYNEAESNLFLLGSTIVEDKLQEKVPQTIRDLRIAHIKIWMLTGDKMDTAYSIGLSCNLITPKMKTFTISGENGESLDKLCNEFREYILENKNFNDSYNLIRTYHKQCSGYEGVVKDFKSNTVVLKSYTLNANDNQKYIEAVKDTFSIIIDSKAISEIFSDKNKTKAFLTIALKAYAVICCRISPLQKSEIVKYVKETAENIISLSIGDGGNDVSMLLEANIGIGVYGEEGMRAVQASDYAIGEFKLLRRLLFHNGRLNNMRINNMILYFFYKNFIFSIIHFYYGFYTNFSGQTIIDDWFIALYNMVFTALPLGIYAVFEIDFSEHDSIIVEKLLPFVYTELRDKPLLTIETFIINLLKAMLQGMLIYLFSINVFYYESFNNRGDTPGLWFFSTIIYTSIILIVNIKLLLITRYLNSLLILVMLSLSIGAYFCLLIVSQYLKLFNSVGTSFNTLGNIKFFSCILLIVSTCYVIDLLFVSFKFNFIHGLNELILNDLKLIKLITKNNMQMINEKSKSLRIKNILKNNSKLKKNKNKYLTFNSLPEYIKHLLEEYVEYELELEDHYSNDNNLGFTDKVNNSVILQNGKIDHNYLKYNNLNNRNTNKIMPDSNNYVIKNYTYDKNNNQNDFSNKRLV